MGVRKKNMADQLKAERKQRAFAKLTNCPTSPACPLKERVGENSPNLCPTMFSVT